MSTVTWKSFFPYILPHIDGCPSLLLEQALRSSAIEFCEKSLIWRQPALGVTVYEDEPCYSFGAPEGARVIQATEVYINDMKLMQTSLHDLTVYEPEWRFRKSTVPTQYFMNDAQSIQLVGVPTEDIPESLDIYVALKPSRDSKICPEFLLEDWGEVIAAGAMVRLLQMPNKPWSAAVTTTAYNYTTGRSSSSGALSSYLRTFRVGINTAKHKTIKSRQLRTAKMQPVAFGEAL